MNARTPTATWRALGTSAELAVTDPLLLGEARDLAVRLVEEVDRTCSRFRADAELVRANAAAGTWVRVDRMLVDAVAAAVHAAEITDGLVDPTLGRVLAAVGYDRDLDDVRSGAVDPASVRLAPAGPRPGAWREIGLDRDGALQVPEGTALDLGATGKAFAADLVASRVSTALGCGVVVSLGGDVAAAGPSPVGEDGPGWPVTVDGDDDGDVPASQSTARTTARSAVQVVLLDGGGLATSSTRRRVWRHGGRLVHHLLDPATGRCVPLIWSEVTVRALTCVDANAASTASMVLGEGAPGWLDGAGLPARLRRPSGALIGTAGWPALAS